jgi:hypothetical protein
MSAKRVVLFAAGAAALSFINVTPSAFAAAATTQPVLACAIGDFGRFVVKPAPTPRGRFMPITITAENISPRTCTVGCRDNPVSVRILNARKRLYLDFANLAIAGCPPDPSSPDGVVQWPIAPGETYDRSITWDQGRCEGKVCSPAAPGNYYIEVRWTRPGGSATKTAKVTIKQEAPCPKSDSGGQLALWCIGITPTVPQSFPSTTIRVSGSS